MLDENVSPAAYLPGSWAVGQPLVTLVSAAIASSPYHLLLGQPSLRANFNVQDKLPSTALPNLKSRKMLVYLLTL
eukprot:854724-Pelagomonas_calceolata.AAC.1